MRRSTQALLLAGLTASALTLATPSAGAATKTLSAGPPPLKPPKGTPKDFDTNAFFRHTVTIHRDDSVRWNFRGFHSVTFVPRGRRGPSFVGPNGSKLVQGQNDAAGNPFWFNGRVPELLIARAAAFPSGGSLYDGTTVANSGLPLGQSKPYKLKFTKTGTFRYVCLVHPGMAGKVRVVRRGVRIPSGRADAQQARREYVRDARKAKSLAALRTPRGNIVQAGRDSGEVSLFRFVGVRRVPVGTTVRLQITRNTYELHTVSFVRAGQDAYLQQQAQRLIDPQTLLLSPIGVYPSEPPGSQVPNESQTNHGNGYFSSGFLDRNAGSPFPASVQVRFTQAGTYNYICLIHPQMRGTLRVG